MKHWKDNVRFVLVEPGEGGNVGASARALKNMGFGHLRLVNPTLRDADTWLAHNAEDVLAEAPRLGSLKEAVADCALVVGTTRRKGKRRGVFVTLEEGMRRAFLSARADRVAVVFGRERKGLTNREAEACGLMVTIPTEPAQPSMNLSHAVAVLAYELGRQERVAGPEAEGAAPSKRMATHEELDHLYERLGAVLAMLEFPLKGSRHPERQTRRVLKRVLGRAALTKPELNVLHGLLGQMERKFGERENGR
ncbi:MAG: TrmJ/YjtD family RNA methyltransferase [Nitrospirota bacterium]